MKTMLLSGLALCAMFGATSATAQEPTPLPVALAVEESGEVLPANTEVLLSTNQEITTKGKTWNEGDTFNLSVVQDVRKNGYIVIPRGSRAVGRISWLTSKGAFGKSGKMDVELEYVEVAGQRIDLSGTYRQEGEGNTVATVGGVVLVGVFGGFITGKSAVIPRGRELMAYTEDDVPLAIPTRRSYAPAGRQLTSASYYADKTPDTDPFVLPTDLPAKSGSSCVIFDTPSGSRITLGQMSGLQEAALERARQDAGPELASLSARVRNESLKAVAASSLGGYSCAN